MVDRYPAHPLSAQAYRWLIRQNASSEARRRHELGQFLLPPAPEVRQAAASEVSRNGAEGRPLRLLGDLAEARRWNEGALAAEPRPPFATAPPRTVRFAAPPPQSQADRRSQAMVHALSEKTSGRPVARCRRRGAVARQPLWPRAQAGGLVPPGSEASSSRRRFR